MARRLRAMPQALSDELERLGGEPAPAAEDAASAAEPPVPLVVFRDRHYRMRTLTSPAGTKLRVHDAQVVVDDPADIDWLDEHPDFERTT